MKYFSIDLSTISAGLSHQLHNLRALITYCYKYKYILILPQFKLSGFHNNGKVIINNLTNYIIEVKSNKYIDAQKKEMDKMGFKLVKNTYILTVD